MPSQIIFTAREIEVLQSSPGALKILASWRDGQQEEADYMGIGTTGDAERATELRQAAKWIEGDL